MSATDEADAIIGEAMRTARDAIMRLESFRDQLHEATAARALSVAPDVATVGALYADHLRCCWGERLDAVARERVRELARVDYTTAPF